MRLDIGPGGKIIGTKRVSPNGQVSGLSDYAGREVLVVLLEDGTGAGSIPSGGPAGWGEAVNDQMRRAFEQYQSLQDLYATPWEATRAFLQSVFPWAPLPSLTEQIHRWIQTQISDVSAQSGTSTEDEGQFVRTPVHDAGAKPTKTPPSRRPRKTQGEARGK